VIVRRGTALGLLLGAALAAACSPQLPKGVDRAVLDTAVNDAIGDPNTCVLIGRPDGTIVYRFGSHMTCGRRLPSCEGAAVRTAGDLLKEVAPRRAAKATSCPTTPDGSRSVGWAWGPTPRHDLMFVAVMEGQTAPPGMVIADKLSDAFAEAGL
jgi:hypothetical protein